MTPTDHNVAGLVSLSYAVLSFCMARTLTENAPRWAVTLAMLSAILNFAVFVLRTSIAGWTLLLGGAR